MRNLFVLTSSIYSEFSSFSGEDRFSQVLECIESIKKKDPSSLIAFVDNSISLEDFKFINVLRTKVDFFLCLRDAPGVSVLKKYTPVPGSALHKGVLDIHSSIQVLKRIKDHFIGVKIKRIFRMSGRYKLMDGFDVSFYDRPEFIGKYSFKKRVPSWNRNDLEYPFFFYLDLWSFPFEFLENAIRLLCKSFYYCMFSNRQIEHVMYKIFSNEPLTEVPVLNVGHYQDEGGKLEVQ